MYFMLLLGFDPTSKSVVEEMHISALKRSHKIKKKKLEQGIVCIQANLITFSILKVLENNTNKSEISNSSAKSLNTLGFSTS